MPQTRIEKNLRCVIEYRLLFLKRNEFHLKTVMPVDQYSMGIGFGVTSSNLIHELAITNNCHRRFDRKQTSTNS